MNFFLSFVIFNGLFIATLHHKVNVVLKDFAYNFNNDIASGTANLSIIKKTNAFQFNLDAELKFDLKYFQVISTISDKKLSTTMPHQLLFCTSFCGCLGNLK
jgi:hypothetical protein